MLFFVNHLYQHYTTSLQFDLHQLAPVPSFQATNNRALRNLKLLIPIFCADRYKIHIIGKINKSADNLTIAFDFHNFTSVLDFCKLEQAGFEPAKYTIKKYRSTIELLLY